jgi:pyridoxamine 5'-phosphate oxidase
MADDITSLRREYSSRAFRRSELSPDPIAQFGRWFAEARAADILEPNAMTLATVGVDGLPSARIVLLKGVDDRGFTFFTNLESKKARQLDARPSAALVFLWKEIERQVRIEGVVERVSDEEADLYFATRPRGSQLGAWASSQSAPIASRAALESRAADVARQFAEMPVPRPPFWGGYRLHPSLVEFWQGRESRLHDRLQYSRCENGVWQIERLSP